MAASRRTTVIAYIIFKAWTFIFWKLMNNFNNTSVTDHADIDFKSRQHAPCLYSLFPFYHHSRSLHSRIFPGYMTIYAMRDMELSVMEIQKHCYQLSENASPWFPVNCCMRALWQKMASLWWLSSPHWCCGHTPFGLFSTVWRFRELFHLRWKLSMYR